MKGTTIGVVSAGPKRMSGDQRKRQIIEVTLRLMEKHGIEGATTARIAAGAGVSEPTLYRHFGSRKAILLAVLSVVVASAMEVIDSSQHLNALQRLREIGQDHTIRTISQKHGFADPLFEFIAAPASLELRQDLRRHAMRFVDRLTDIVEEGKSQGSIRPEVDSTEVAWRIMGFFWFEDVAYLYGFQHAVLNGPSTKSLDSILREIATEPPV